MKPIISIVIPVYNTEKYLDKCITSILSSTLKEIEVILVDDGSKDSSPEICDKYADLDDRIKVIHQPNGGVSVARNNGIASAEGVWLTFVDSDDYIFPDYYKDLLKIAIDNKVDIVRTTNFLEKNGILTTISSTHMYPKFDTESCEIAIGGGYKVDVKLAREMVLLDVWTSNLPIGIYKKTLFENVTFPEGRTYEDLAVGYLPYYNCSTDVVVYNKPYYVYNCNNINSICRSSNNTAKRNYDIFLAFADRYYFSVDNETGLSMDLLKKTISNALGAYNAGVYYNRPEITECAKEFLFKHKYFALKDKKISRINHTQLLMFYYFRYVYGIIIRLIYRAKKR